MYGVLIFGIAKFKHLRLDFFLEEFKIRLFFYKY